ncbi:4856_t:CDS:1, partial [Scutellospora calospora]
ASKCKINSVLLLTSCYMSLLILSIIDSSSFSSKKLLSKELSELFSKISSIFKFCCSLDISF